MTETRRRRRPGPSTRAAGRSTPTPIQDGNGRDGQDPSRHAWTVRVWVHPATRSDQARATRKEVPRARHAAFEPAAGRDPIGILEAQEADRLQDLVPLRHQRMAESPFAYYRGTPAVMAFDLASAPRTGITVQANGDAHLSNFGLFASPERALMFDANDFDETLPGPWEWDVKRLAASVVIAGRANGFSPTTNRKATMAAVAGYRQWMSRYAAMGLVDVLYATITADDIVEAAVASGRLSGRLGAARRKVLESVFAKARRRDGMRAFDSLTEIVDGRRVIRDDPPVLTHVQLSTDLERVFYDYRASLSEGKRDFLERFRFLDFALKVVGVGSVGTRCFVIVLQGRDENDALILQAKEATSSVLAAHLQATEHPAHGQRVVVGQQLTQATSDVFLGWAKVRDGRDFYFRQLWDMKGAVEPRLLKAPGLGIYGALCGRALARGHARSGDAVAIAAYLGTSDAFDGAIADFAETYADVNAADHAAYLAAIEAGRVSLPAAEIGDRS